MVPSVLNTRGKCILQKSNLNNKLNCTNAVASPLTKIKDNKNTFVLAKLDSGASDNYVRTEDSECLTDIQEHRISPVILPDKTTIHASKCGGLPFSRKLGDNTKKPRYYPR